MQPILFLAAAGAEASEGTISVISRTFGVHGASLLSSLIVFGIIVFVLAKYAYPPVLEMLEKRRVAIAEGLANADKIKEELAQTEAAREEILLKANQQANTLIDEARAAAAKVKDQETQRAVSTAEDIIAKAREATEADRARMVAEVKQDIGQLVVQVAAKVTGKVLTDDDQKRLIDDANKDLAV